MAPDPPIAIVIADDHTVMRNGLRLLLEAEPDLSVVSEAGSIQTVFSVVRSHRPTVLLLDLNMPGGSSVEAIGRLRRMSPGTAIVVLTMEDDSAWMREAYAAGASGYVLKDSAATELVRAIRAAAQTPGPPRR
jgi:two-component system, NarL family, response regulator NreC